MKMESKYSERLDEMLNKRRDTNSNEIKELEEFIKSLKEKERELEKIYEEKHKKLEEVYQSKMKGLEEMYHEKVKDFENEKQKMLELNKIQNEIVNLNIGGHKFTTSLQTLQTDAKSMLGVMFSGRHVITKQDDGTIFIDRDGRHFHIILNYLRGNILSIEQLPVEKLVLSDLLSEVEYYQLGGLHKIIKPKEKEKTTITQSELEKQFQENEHGWKFTTRDVSFRNCVLDSLTFRNIRFKHSLDLSDSSLVNAIFFDCCFYHGCRYSFDGADLRGCKFGWSWVRFKDLIKNKQITFYQVKNIEQSKFDNEEARRVIRETYNV